MTTFKTQATGKWILAGEHSVLRGGRALVFPLTTKYLTLEFQPGDTNLELELKGEQGSELKNLFLNVIDVACKLVGIQKSTLQGKLILENSIPIGAGLGASAALCVVLTKWFLSKQLILENDQYEFARKLENLFHGESSGVDIAVAMSSKPLKFQREGDRKEWVPEWVPNFKLTYSDQKGVTLECVNKVKLLIEKNPLLGKEIDQDMKTAVELCEEALEKDEMQGFHQLIKGIELAQSCFERWGLVDELCSKKILDLKEAGASAVKMTGSGGGGYILSLWPNGKSPVREVL